LAFVFALRDRGRRPYWNVFGKRFFGKRFGRRQNQRSKENAISQQIQENLNRRSFDGTGGCVETPSKKLGAKTIK
jgi:hypothetical protein